MAYLDHIDPGNSGGSIPIPDTYNPIIPKPRIFHCPLCNEKFPNEEERRQHRISTHPIKRPYLFIKGQSPRHEEIRITTMLSEEDICIEDADSADLDGNHYKVPMEAVKDLINKQKGIRKLILLHQNYQVKYQLFFEIARVSTLIKIEELFYDIFSSALPMAKQLELFDEKVHSLESDGLYYAGALGSYISAIMAKDRMPDSAIKFEEHINKLGESLDKLNSFDRPLAQSIMAIISFMINDFSEAEGDLSTPEINASKIFFRSGKFQSYKASTTSNMKIPVDTTSEMITKYCTGQKEYRIGDMHKLVNIYRASITAEEDKQKISFILWLASKESRNVEDEKMYRRKIIHSNSFCKIVDELEESINE